MRTTFSADKSSRKTLIQMIIMAVTGLTAAPWSSSEEERRKAILSYLALGVSSILWDNIPRGEHISSPAIELACTSEIYRDRKLGASEIVAAASSAINMFTGNNIGRIVMRAITRVPHWTGVSTYFFSLSPVLISETTAPISLSKRSAARASSKSPQRSRVGNGTELVVGANGNSVWVRRCKELIAEHVSDLGGVDNASAAERSLVRRACVLTVELEQLAACRT